MKNIKLKFDKITRLIYMLSGILFYKTFSYKDLSYIIFYILAGISFYILGLIYECESEIKSDYVINELEKIIKFIRAQKSLKSTNILEGYGIDNMLEDLIKNKT